MSRQRVAGAALGIALLLALSACSGPGEDELVAQAKADFEALVDDAAAADVEVLRTLEVEDPVSEACDAESDAEHTVFVAAGTMAVQSTLEDAAQLLFGLEPPAGAVDDEEERWTAVDGLANDERAYRDKNGITAAVSVHESLLVITVFSPCR